MIIVKIQMFLSKVTLYKTRGEIYYINIDAYPANPLESYITKYLCKWVGK